MSETTEQAKHTPGSWTVWGTFENGDRMIDCGDAWVAAVPIPDLWTASEMPEEGYPEAMADANARLIAAAPDLLEASRTALGVILSMWGEQGGGKSGRARDALRAAIAKAEGR